jgi:hypothetical protein
MERRTLRVKARPIPVLLSTGTLDFPGEILSLSTKGLFVRASELPPIGTRIRVVLEDREAGKMEIVGEVRWTTDHLQAELYSDQGFGLRFTEWNESYHNFFERMLFVYPSSDMESTGVSPRGPRDRRRAPRVDAPSPVYFVAGRREGVGVLADLSLTGARIEDASPRLSPGVAMTLLLELRQESFSVELPGRVVRQTETGFAIEFSFDPDSSAEAFLRWILRRPERLRPTEPGGRPRARTAR